MFIMTNAKSIEKFTAQTEEALQPIEALLRAWSHEMEPEKDVGLLECRMTPVSLHPLHF
jgi:hypothetical protein